MRGQRGVRGLLLAAIVATGCSQVGPQDDGTGGTGPGSDGETGAAGRGGTGNANTVGTGTAGWPGTGLLADDLVSNFGGETASVARVRGRNGTWYAYNDGSTTCAQGPPPGVPFSPEPPPVTSPGPSAGKALRAAWDTCNTWGAGIGADLCVPLTENEAVYTGTRIGCDLRIYAGLVLWARATPGTDTLIRVKLPTLAEVSLSDGGLCDETLVGVGKCSDSHGQVVALPPDGSWRQIRISFTDPSFKQEGWGALFPWDPTRVVGIQIQSVELGELYEIWIDDVYLVRDGGFQNLAARAIAGAWYSY